MIQLIFTNGSQTVELKYVRNVQWGVVQDDESIISSARRGQRVRSVTINGFLNKSMFADNVAAQQQLETDLLSVAEGTLQYTGAADIENARFVRLDFQEFRGNPICEFTIEFETNEDNVAAHNPIQIGALTLSPANGYDHASVNDRIATQGPDEQLVNNRNREFVIEGSFVGADLDTINEKQADLIAEVENKTTLVVTLSTGSGAFVGSYTVRPGQLEFSSPMLRERNVARTFRFTCRTFEDYGKEPYTLGEVPQTYGNITFDVVKGVDNNRNREKTSAGNVYADLTEELIVRGQRWFRTWTEYTTFRDSFDPINTLNHFVVSATGNRLELSDINVGSFERDGNFTDGAKRYVVTVDATFIWQKNIEGVNIDINQTRMSTLFYKISNMTVSANVDDQGSVTARTISFSAEIFGDTAMQDLRNRVGQVFDYGDPSLFFYTNLYITSVTVNSKDLVNVAGTQATLYKVSVQAQQLDNATQAIYFIDSLFRMSKAGGSGTSYSTDTVQFDNVTSLNKSISNRWDGITQRFIATSITISISGEVWEPDNGSGEPSNPDRVLALFNKLDALMNAEQSSQGTPNTVPAGETLPSNADVHFFLNNISIGNWTSFTKQNAPNKGERYWKQTTSLSMTAVFDLTGSSNNQPDFVDSRSITIGEESPKFTQLQVLNQGTVFKRIGTNPGKATVTVQRQFRDGRVFVAGQLPATLDPEPTEWPGFANSEKTRDSTETRGFTNRQIREYIATEKIT